MNEKIMWAFGIIVVIFLVAKYSAIAPLGIVYGMIMGKRFADKRWW